MASKESIIEKISVWRESTGIPNNGLIICSRLAAILKMMAALHFHRILLIFRK